MDAVLRSRGLSEIQDLILLNASQAPATGTDSMPQLLPATASNSVTEPYPSS